MKRNHIINIFSHTLFLAISLTFAAPPAQAAEMEDYCIVPPYVKRDLKPNILILTDNSARVGLPAYRDGNIDPISGLQIYEPRRENPSLGIYNSSQDSAGLFQENLWYEYPNGAKDFHPDPGGVFHGSVLNWATTSMSTM